MVVNLKQETTGLMKQVKVGFSWTTLFFGCFPALFRGDWKWALIMFVVAWVSFSISWFVFPFIYNKLYIRDLISKGYKPADQASADILRAKGIIVN